MCFAEFYYDYYDEVIGNSTYTDPGQNCDRDNIPCQVAEYYCYGNTFCEEAVRGCQSYKQCLAIAVCHGRADCSEQVADLAE